MKQALIATKAMTYGTRRLVAGDEFEAPNPDARVLVAIGKAKRNVKPGAPEHDEITMLRAEYERVVGKRPYMGWDATKMREKIAAVQAGE